MPSKPASARRARSLAARGFGKAATISWDASRRLSAAAGPSIEGDRWVEWSFVFARMAEGPGTTLDFGADIGFLSLGAAQRGHDVVALDRMPDARSYHHKSVEFVQADILERPLADRRFDQILNCSSVEHVGLAGRYDSSPAPDGDLDAMAHLRSLLAPDGRMIITVPAGRDAVCSPHHRIYGEERLPRLLEGFTILEEQYWHKDAGAGWVQCERADALAVEGSKTFYALALAVLGVE